MPVDAGRDVVGDEMEDFDRHGGAKNSTLSSKSSLYQLGRVLCGHSKASVIEGTVVTLQYTHHQFSTTP
jgi:hypothetical protein